MSQGPFIQADTEGLQYCEVVDGHLAWTRRAEGPGPFAGLARAVEALRAVGCEPEAKFLETSGTGYWPEALTDILVRGLTRLAREQGERWAAALSACRVLRRQIVAANKPPPLTWDIRRKGRKWSGDEMHLKWESLGEGDIEVVGGKLFDDHPARMAVLAMLLENVGIDAALRLVDLALWKEAIDAALRAKRAKAAAGRKRVKSKRRRSKR